MILMIAHWSWMDPAIANLVPVLDSYWLMIHVSVIVGSYGPFALNDSRYCFFDFDFDFK